MSGKRPSWLLGKTADQVAKAGYDGFMAGRRLVVPGLGNKLVALMPRLLPRSTALSTIQRYQQGRERKGDGWPKRPKT